MPAGWLDGRDFVQWSHRLLYGIKLLSLFLFENVERSFLQAQSPVDDEYDTLVEIKWVRNTGIHIYINLHIYDRFI